MKKRILFVSYTADWTGPTKSLSLLLRHLRATFQVAVVAPGEGPFIQYLAENNIQCHTVSNLTKRAIPALSQIIRREKFDLIYANSTHGSSRNALIAAKLAGNKRFICHVREMGWNKTWRALGYLQFADATVVVSEAAANSIARFTREKLRYVIHNGISLDDTMPERPYARTHLINTSHLPSESLVLVSVAHVTPRKGQHYLIQAFAKAVKKFPTAKLILIGSTTRDSTYTEFIKDMIREYALSHSVQLLGFREDVGLLLRGADIFVHTAIREPHPRALLEAMLAQLPVVAFGVDGITETVVDGETGYLTPPGDPESLARQICALLARPDLRVAFGMAGSRRVHEHFLASSTAKRVAHVISEVLDAHTL